jgi:hypothetical protein
MTRTVTEKAMQLLAKSVSDIAGEERRIADALVMTLRSNEQVFRAPVQFGLKNLEPMMRQRIHGHAAAVASGLTVH